MAELENPAYENDQDSLLFGDRLRPPWYRLQYERGTWIKIGLIAAIVVAVGLGGTLIVFLVNPKTAPPLPTIPTTTTMATTTSTTSIATSVSTTSVATTISTTTLATTTTTKPSESLLHTIKPLPENATDIPPVSLLYEMGLHPAFEEVPCETRPTHQPFKWMVTVVGLTFTSPGADRKPEAKTGAAMAANEALFGIHYPSHPAPTYQCHDTSGELIDF